MVRPSFLKSSSSKDPRKERFKQDGPAKLARKEDTRRISLQRKGRDGWRAAIIKNGRDGIGERSLPSFATSSRRRWHSISSLFQTFDDKQSSSSIFSNPKTIAQVSIGHDATMWIRSYRCRRMCLRCWLLAQKYLYLPILSAPA